MSESRAHLLGLLELHEPADAQEAESLDFILDFVRQRQDPFARSNQDAHVTASGFMMHEGEPRTLLVWHTKLQRWLQPGGHVESDDPSTYESARRECLEETGYEALDGPAGGRILDVDVHIIPERPGVPEHKHLDVRYAFVAGSEVGKPDHKTRWVAREEIPSLNLDPAAVRALTKAFSLRA